MGRRIGSEFGSLESIAIVSSECRSVYRNETQLSAIQRGQGTRQHQYNLYAILATGTFLKISPFLERIQMEHIGTKNRVDSKLQIDVKISVRICF